MFILGAFFGFATANSSKPVHPHSSGAVIGILDWGIQHLFALTLLALICLIWPLLSGRAKESKGLPIYFGIGLCLARLAHGI